MTISGPAVDDLRSALRGQVLCPGDPGYDRIRRIFNAMIDRRPAFIARCASAADVVACVQFARAEGLDVSIRGGRHNVSGKPVGEGLMIDLSRMNGARIDPRLRTARAETGLTLADLDRDCQRFGLGTPLGHRGPHARRRYRLARGKHGLACDNAFSVDIVTADGTLLTPSATEYPDLFWPCGAAGAGPIRLAGHRRGHCVAARSGQARADILRRVRVPLPGRTQPQCLARRCRGRHTRSQH